MNRRDLIALLGSTAVSWPVGVHRIGVLMSTGEHDREGNARLAAFRQGLQELGWDDRNLHIDVRWTGSNPEEIRRFAAELPAAVKRVPAGTIRQRFNAAAARSRATQQSREAVPGSQSCGFLNAVAIPTARGGRWQVMTISNVLARA